MDNNGTKKKGKKVIIVVAIIIVVLLAAVGAYALSEASYERGKRDAQMQNDLTNRALEHNNGQAASPSDVQQDPSSSTDIGLDKAKSIALSQVSGAAESDIVKAHREHDDGRLEYEIEIRYDGYEYEFKIDAATGQILGSESDRADWF